MKRFFTAALMAAALVTGGAYAEGGPKIDNPPCKPGECPEFTAGFARDKSTKMMSEAEAKTMRQVVVSNRCFVTTVDYCLMGGYAAVGAYCECTDGWYVYPGVVY
jgi:hypothetical protein